MPSAPSLATRPDHSWTPATRNRLAAPPDPPGVFGQVRTLLFILVALDLVLLAANVRHLVTNGDEEPRGRFSDDVWDGDEDLSFIELFGHAQLFAAAVILLTLALTRRTVLYGAWGVALLLLVLDDFARIHEEVGQWLVAAFDVPGVAGLRPQDIGELSVFAVEGLIIGGVLVVSTLRAPRFALLDSLALMACVAFLAVFGIAVDMLNVLLAEDAPLRVGLAFTLIETAGEILAMSVIVVVVVHMALLPGRLLSRSGWLRPRGDAPAE